jgi:hypothetical protein
LRILKFPWLFGILFVLLSSAFLRFYNLGQTSYWIDEMSSINFATNPYWGALFWDNSSGFYNFILKIWIELTSTSEVSTRSLSALLSFSITLCWLRTGYLLWGRWGSIFLGLLHSVLFLSVYFGRETRMYSLLEQTSSLLFMFLLLQQNGRKINPWAFLSVLVALTLSHYLSFIPLLVASAWLLKGARDLNKKYAGLFIVAASFGIVGLAFHVRSWPLAWMNILFKADHPFRWPFEMSFEVLGGWVGCTSFLGISTIAIISKSKLALKALGSILGAIGASVLAGLYLEKAFFYSRYFVFLSPLIVILFAAVVFESKNFLKYGAALFSILFLGSQAYASFQSLKRVNPDWRLASDVAGKIENIQVFTTRPLSLASPYFDAQSLSIERLAVQGEFAFSQITDALASHKRPVILENPEGFSFYENDLKRFFSGTECQFQNLATPQGSFGGIVLFEIYCP